MTSRKTAAKETTNAETIHSSNSPIFQYLNFSFHGHFKKENHNMKNTVYLFNAKGAWKIIGILCVVITLPHWFMQWKNHNPSGSC